MGGSGGRAGTGGDGEGGSVGTGGDGGSAGSVGTGGTGGSAGSGGTAGTGGDGGTGGTDMTSPTATVDPTTVTLGKTAAITIAFSESMDTATLVLDGALGDESDGGVWSMNNAANDTLTLSPTSSWTSGPGRNLTVDAADLAGNALAPLARSYLVKLVFDNFQNAAVVVGQADFLGTDDNQGGTADANTLADPFGNPAVDNGRLFVGDYSNNRVLAFNALPTVNNANADFVLGQPDFTTTEFNTTRSGMAGPQSIATVGGKMVVAEYMNNRVLIYNSIPTDDSALPDVVVGQPDFVTSTSTCTADSLDSPETATVTPGGKLIVTDGVNSRVLIWNALPTTNGQAADMVLGQGDMTHCAGNDDDQDNASDGAPTARTLYGPGGVWADDTRLVVGDTSNNRVLIWTAFPTTDFQPADLVLGQSNFTNNAPNDDNQDGIEDATPTARTMFFPYDGVHANGVQLVVTDTDNTRTLIWNSFPTTSFQPADLVLGQSNFTNNAPNDDNQDGTSDANASARTQAYPTGALFYEDKLLVADANNSRLLIYQSQ
jgi:hypothetical protein